MIFKAGLIDLKQQENTKTVVVIAKGDGDWTQTKGKIILMRVINFGFSQQGIIRLLWSTRLFVRVSFQNESLDGSDDKCNHNSRVDREKQREPDTCGTNQPNLKRQRNRCSRGS